MIKLTTAEYNDLLDYANKKAIYFNNNLLIPKYDEIHKFVNKELNISGTDVLHNLILKYSDSNFSFLKKKVSGEFIRLYFDFRKNSEPNFDFDCRKRYNDRIKTDPKLKQHHRERVRDYSRNRKQSDPEYREHYNNYRREWRKKQREIYGKCPN